MRLFFAMLLVGLTAFSCTHHTPDSFTKVVDASCGTCNFDMTGDECELAVKIEDKHYYVEGSAIDEHGDAHAADGFCSTVRKAKVTGVIKNGVFKSSSFELLPQ